MVQFGQKLTLESRTDFDSLCDITDTDFSQAQLAASVCIPQNIRVCKMNFGLMPINCKPEYTEEELRQTSETENEKDRESETVESNGSNTVCRCDRCSFNSTIVPEEKTCCRQNNFTVSN